MLVQLCDLEDETVQAVLRGPVPKAAQCRLRTGWLSQKEHSTVLQHVKGRFQVRLSAWPLDLSLATTRSAGYAPSLRYQTLADSQELVNGLSADPQASQQS